MTCIENIDYLSEFVERGFFETEEITVINPRLKVSINKEFIKLKFYCSSKSVIKIIFVKDNKDLYMIEYKSSLLFRSKISILGILRGDKLHNVNKFKEFKKFIIRLENNEEAEYQIYYDFLKRNIKFIFKDNKFYIEDEYQNGFESPIDIKRYFFDYSIIREDLLKIIS